MLSDSRRVQILIYILFFEFARFVILKVIPLKLFYYQTFLKLGVINIHDMDIKKNAIKKRGHRACLHVNGLLKWGIFTGCGSKIRITFIQS